MTEKEYIEIKEAFADAVQYAIQKIGMKNFKKCSFFGSNMKGKQ